MKKLDLKQELRHLYLPSARKAELVQVPRLQFAMIDGAIEKGQEPGTSQNFQEATQAMYGIAYTLKFAFKKRKTNAVDYPVMALEGLWWVEDGTFDITVKDNWCYTLMILQPDIVTAEAFEDARAQVRRKRGESMTLSSTATRQLRRRLVRAAHARRPVRDGTGHGGAYEGLCARERLSGLRGRRRKAPRDLPGRSAPGRPGQAQDGTPASGGTDAVRFH